MSTVGIDDIDKHKMDYWMDFAKSISNTDIAAMEGQLRVCVEDDRRHDQVNDVKLDAIHTAKTYEEFADRVAAAHLRPLEKKDFKGRTQSWNQYASKERDSE